MTYYSQKQLFFPGKQSHSAIPKQRTELRHGPFYLGGRSLVHWNKAKKSQAIERKHLVLQTGIRDENKKKESPPPTSLPHPHPPPQKNYWQLNEWNSRKRLESHAQSHNNGHSLSVQSELKKITSFSGRTFLIARNAQLLGKLVFCPYYSEPPVKLRSYIKF